MDKLAQAQALMDQVKDVERQIYRSEIRYVVSHGMRMSRDLGRVHLDAALGAKTDAQRDGEAEMAIGLLETFLKNVKGRLGLEPTGGAL